MINKSSKAINKQKSTKTSSNDLIKTPPRMVVYGTIRKNNLNSSFNKSATPLTHKKRHIDSATPTNLHKNRK